MSSRTPGRMDAVSGDLRSRSSYKKVIVLAQLAAVVSRDGDETNSEFSDEFEDANDVARNPGGGAEHLI